MDDVARLLAIEEIKQLKARYFRCVDTKDWGALARVFAPNIRFDVTAGRSVRNPWTGEWNPPVSPTPVVVSGREAVVAMVRQAVEPYHCVHHGHMPEIEILSATEAKGVWAMQDMLRDASHNLVAEGSGHYYETYEKLETGWAIKTARLERLSLLKGGKEGEPARYL